MGNMEGGDFLLPARRSMTGRQLITRRDAKGGGFGTGRAGHELKSPGGGQGLSLVRREVHTVDDPLPIRRDFCLRRKCSTAASRSELTCGSA
jgi:hypothetical protein